MPVGNRVTRVLALLAAALAGWGCGSSAADHEALGDRAYVGRQFGDALVEYRIAIKQHSTARLRAKAGSAALHVGDLGEAAAQYVALVHDAADRRGEAEDGLERVARAAIQANDRAGLTAAIAGLRKMNATRPLGALAAPLARGISENGSAADAAALLPVAAAAAPDARQQDSLMLQYAPALTRGGRCDSGLAIFEALVRRQRDPGLVRSAQQGLVQCELQQGRQALEQGQPQQAEEWLRRAAADGADTPSGRAAYVGLGDVMLARGDYPGAADAYLRATQGAPPGDSIAQQARQKLDNLSNAGTVVR